MENLGRVVSVWWETPQVVDLVNAFRRVSVVMHTYELSEYSSCRSYMSLLLESSATNTPTVILRTQTNCVH